MQSSLYAGLCQSSPPDDPAGHLTASIMSVSSAENTEPCREHWSAIYL